jgi:hypothetical protein
MPPILHQLDITLRVKALQEEGTYLRGFKRIVITKVNVDYELATLVRSIRLNGRISWHNQRMVTGPIKVAFQLVRLSPTKAMLTPSIALLFKSVSSYLQG